MEIQYPICKRMYGIFGFHCYFPALKNAQCRLDQKTLFSFSSYVEAISYSHDACLTDMTTPATWCRIPTCHIICALVIDFLLQTSKEANYVSPTAQQFLQKWIPLHWSWIDGVITLSLCKFTMLEREMNSLKKMHIIIHHSAIAVPAKFRVRNPFRSRFPRFDSRRRQKWDCGNMSLFCFLHHEQQPDHQRQHVGHPHLLGQPHKHLCHEPGKRILTCPKKVITFTCKSTVSFRLTVNNSCGKINMGQKSASK